MSDFNYVPSYRSDVTDQFRILRAQFGDGYAAMAPEGVNPVSEVWKLVFDQITVAEGEAIRSFLRGKIGQSFTWTNPNGVEKRYTVVGEVTMPRTGPSSVSLTCTFEEWFG
jgi:phage-related protein